MEDKFILERLPVRKQKGEWITVRMRVETYDRVRAVASETNQQISHIYEKCVDFAFDHLEIVDFKEDKDERK